MRIHDENDSKRFTFYIENFSAMAQAGAANIETNDDIETNHSGILLAVNTSQHSIVADGNDDIHHTSDTTQALETKEDGAFVNSNPVPSTITTSVTPPRSMVAPTSDHSKRDALFSKCCNHFYDIGTILISIGDITTDIMVMLSYYYADRMTFFWISFAILLTAQIGYILVFFLSFEVNVFIEKIFDTICCDCCDNCCGLSKEGSPLKKCCSSKYMQCVLICTMLILMALVGLTIFALILPFGHLVAFLMFFAENDESAFSKWLYRKVGIKKRTNIPLEDRMSDMAKFTASKLNKHGGFILEAFLEALPQSILQLVAMVYFQEPSYIAVGSIVLSMTSIMSKSLVISQGLDWKSYLWTWLCVITDFFSIFFVVSWLFLSNDQINGDFLGHFSIIGQVWCYKVLIAVIPFFVLVLVAYVCVGFWVLVWELYVENRHKNTFFVISMLCLFATCGNALIIVGLLVLCFVAILFMEIACFSFMAFVVWVFFTSDRWDYTRKKVAGYLHLMLRFVGNASLRNNDRVIRVLAINYAYKKTDKLGKWITERKEDESLQQVTWSDIRNNCENAKTANIVSDFSRALKELPVEYKQEFFGTQPLCTNFHHLHDFSFATLGMIFVFLTMPIYMVSRVVTIAYPYWIAIYLTRHGLWSEMQLFELVMLGSYIGLQIVIFVLGIFVYRMHKWLWHVAPGTMRWNMQWTDDTNAFLHRMYAFYDAVQWLPVVRTIVLRSFGPDIGPIVMIYVKAIQAEAVALP